MFKFNVGISWRSDLKERYFIVIVRGNCCEYFRDTNIAQKIGIPLREYQRILKDFGAYIYNQETYFHNKEDAEKVLKFIKEKYEILLAMDIG